MPFRILIADDDHTICRLLRRLLEEHADWQVCGEAHDGFDAVAKVEHYAPDLVVMDLAMPRMNGIQAGQEISKIRHDLPMLLLSVQQMSGELVAEARSAGFRGAVSKDNGTEVVKGIEALLRNEDFFLQELRDRPQSLEAFQPSDLRARNS